MQGGFHRFGQPAAVVVVKAQPILHHLHPAAIAAVNPGIALLVEQLEHRVVAQRFGYRYWQAHHKALTLGPVLIQGLYNTLGTVDRKSTRLNSSHVAISYAVFCLKKK